MDPNHPIATIADTPIQLCETLSAGIMFRKLPIELIDYIAQGLELKDVQNLRLTSKQVRDKFRFSFQRHFHNQKTDLSAESRQRLEGVAASTEFSSAVRCLTVTATVYDPSDLKDSVCTEHEECHGNRCFGLSNHAAAEWLIGIMKKLVTLETLSLDAHVIQGAAAKKRNLPYNRPHGNWRVLWRRALDVFKIALTAAVKSKVQLRSFCAYPTTLYCSMEGRAITAVIDELTRDPSLSTALANSVASLEELALNFSPPIRTESEVQVLYDQWVAQLPRGMRARLRPQLSHGFRPTSYYMTDSEHVVSAPENLDGVQTVLRLPMPHLRRLDLRLYNTLNGHAKAYSKLFSHIADELQFPSLEHCIMRGIRATEAALLRFLDKHTSTLRHLELHGVILTDGTWHPIFAKISAMGKSQRLCRVSASHLYTDETLFNLAPKADDGMTAGMVWSGYISDNGTFFPCVGGDHVYAREFGPEVLQRGLLEFASQELGEPLGSPYNNNRLMVYQANFGPP